VGPRRSSLFPSLGIASTTVVGRHSLHQSTSSGGVSASGRIHTHDRGVHASYRDLLLTAFCSYSTLPSFTSYVPLALLPFLLMLLFVDRRRVELIILLQSLPQIGQVFADQFCARVKFDH
jgi:hypothetical protein